ncbi:hypothetical protein [Actinoplanes sp. L3-i22]|uniref:hypothetical protein n=1 Tax=Actinoplanes sp. L3-i22 TaxID=2836373 RepID=UPI001C76CE01|nr:hypothetical protein [Actinoplanes sp. L3-i22]BCY14548.1 hypothetical protein L3i22_096360 [Actinoplanes sp. L3-i22]
MPGDGPGGRFGDDFDQDFDVRAEPGPAEPQDGLGAQLYEVMSDSERETAVAETLLFRRPDFGEEPPAAVLPPAAETILFTRPPEWDEHYPADPDSHDFAPPARREVSPLTETFLFGTPAPLFGTPAPHAQEPRSPIDGAAETLLFAGLARALATPAPEPAAWEKTPAAEPAAWEAPGPLAWETPAPEPAAWEAPAHIADSAGWAAGTELTPDAIAEPVDWTGDGGGWAEPPYPQIAEQDRRIAEGPRRAWAEIDRNAAQPLPAPSPYPRKRKTYPEDFETGAAGLERPGRVVNRKRSRAAEIDRNTPAPDAAYAQAPNHSWHDSLVEGQDRQWHDPVVETPGRQWHDSVVEAPGQQWHDSLVEAEPGGPWTAASQPEHNAAWTTANPEELNAGWTTANPEEPSAGWSADDLQDLNADWNLDDPRGLQVDQAGLVPEDLPEADPLLLGAETSRELSPAAEAAWRAFAVGDREPGTEIRTNRRAKSRWTTFTGESEPEQPKRRIFLWPVFLRCLLYLGPLSVAVAGVGALGHVAWPVPAVTLLLGWAAAQALTSVGVTVARRADPEAAVRLIGVGFAAVTALYWALVWIAPASLLGHDRLLAAAVGAGGLATLATVTAALVTRSETAVILWYLPCWLLAGTSLAAGSGASWAGHIPVATLLPGAIVAVLIRAFKPAVLIGRECRIPRLTPAERRRGLAYLVIGAAQASCVALLWQAGPAGAGVLAALPLLLAVPMLEALIGWHTDRIDAGLDSAQTVAELDRHVRNVTVITLAGLLPPLAAGGALALAAYQLPYQLAALGGTRAAVLALAAGTLLGGVFAITFLLATRARTGIAATLAAAPPVATLALPVLPQPDAGPLPLAVAVLAATHVAGLLIVAMTAADLRRTS